MIATSVLALGLAALPPRAQPDSGIPCAAHSVTKRSFNPGGVTTLPDGATWTCVLGRYDSLDVTLSIESDTARDISTIRTMTVRRIHSRAPVFTAVVDKDPWGFAMLAAVDDAIRAIDIDGDGFRDLQLDFQLPRSTNRYTMVWMYDPARRMLIRHVQLSGLMNVSPERKGCVHYAQNTGPGPDDGVSGEYCLRRATWVETSRDESSIDDAHHVQVENHYRLRGGRMVLVKADTTRLPP
jgi:hypothetical protein